MTRRRRHKITLFLATMSLMIGGSLFFASCSSISPPFPLDKQSDKEPQSGGASYSASEKRRSAQVSEIQAQFAYEADTQTRSGLERHSKLDQLLQAYPSARNQDLIRRLKSGQLEYLLLYPMKQEAGGKKGARSGRDATQGGPATANTVTEPLKVWRISQDAQVVSQQQQQRLQNAASASVVGSWLEEQSKGSGARANQVLGHYNRTNVVIKAFNYKFRLDLELNNNLFGPALIQKHFLAKGAQQISTQKVEHCYYHARTNPDVKPSAIGAFRTCNGLSGIIHVNNESFVIHPFYNADLSKKHPHIIYRYQTGSNFDFAKAANNNRLDENNNNNAPITHRECGNTRLHEWALRQYNKLITPLTLIGEHKRSSRQLNELKRTRKACTTNNCDNIKGEQENKSANINKLNILNASGDDYKENNKTIDRIRFSKRDVSLTEKYIELGLVLSQDFFDKRNSSTRLEVLHDAIQIINCLDLYFRSVNTRVSLIYVETWAHGDQIELSSDVKQTLYNFLEYSKRKLYKVSSDAVHLLTGGHARQFDSNEVGMSIPDSICSSKAASISQEASAFEPFIAASTIAHMLGHNLGMEHDDSSLATPVQANALESSQPLATPTALHRSLSPHQADRAKQHSSSLQGTQQMDSEEHDDEIRSRSLGLSGNVDEESLEENNWAQEANSCQWNCLMSPRFAYLQPPVTFGNMVLQEVSSSGGGNGSQPTAPGSDLNGKTMEHIDAELTNESDNFNSQAALNLPFKFSRQSIETYHKLLRLGHGICLFNKPNQLEDFKTCGNGIVDRGEDCDCGSFQECLEQDSCCDPITCRFKADVECISGACCDRCRLRGRGFVCRKSRGECDLAETCDGKSGQCGPDVHKQNGFPCNQNSAYCYLGQCSNHDTQCAELWGSDARQSDPLCYASFNVNGTIRGNCGFDFNQRKYRRCESENMMCGTLQCQLGDMKPIMAASAPASDASNSNTAGSVEFSKKTLHPFEGGHHECKAITGPANPFSNQLSSSSQTTTTGANSPLLGHVVGSISYVREGSKCAPNKVCFNQTCQPIELVYKDSFELCPRDEKGRQCSANGICSTANRCHCEPGWLGHDCSQRWSMESGAESISSPNNTTPAPFELPGAQAKALSEALNSPAVVLVHGLAQSHDQRLVNNNEPAANVESTTTAATTTTTTTSTQSHEITATSPQTDASTTTNATTTQPAPATASPATVVLDKKKHKGFSSPMLVFILVSIVGGVYVGFALMACCYRRKGFLKPDKVLRHHQMNCKLDAMRNSFIAKRLADADANGMALLDSSSNPSCSNGHIDLVNPFATNAMLAANSAINQPSILSQSNTCHHLGAIYSSTGASVYPTSNNDCLHRHLNNCFEAQQQQQQQSSTNEPLLKGFAMPNRILANNNQFASATVHYFDDQTQQQQQQQQCDYMQQSNLEEIEPETDDRIPFLVNNDAPHRQHQSLILNQRQPVLMRTFNRVQTNQIVDNQQQQQQQNLKQLIYQDQQYGTLSQEIPISRTSSYRPFDHSMNRAISLGNVNRQARVGQAQANLLDLEADDEENRRTMTVHRALVTPSRVRGPYPGGGTVKRYCTSRRANPLEVDSCSAPSSPEHRDPCWSDAERQRRRISLVNRPTNNYTSVSRQSSNLRPVASNAAYHEEALFGALSVPNGKQIRRVARRQRSAEDEDMPLPPPPLEKQQLDIPGISSQHLLSDGRRDDVELTEDDCDLVKLISSKRKSEPSATHSPISSTSWSIRNVKRIPLNDGEEPLATESELTLIAQLQQLERAQSLNQASGDKRLAMNSLDGGLDEFFSLPLSVQLRTLLTRTLQDSRDHQSINTPIDDYLNSFGSFGGASTNRRTISGQQTGPSGSGSLSGTLKRKQVNLQNLQGLINKLQQLHNQTIIQQQLEELRQESESVRGSRQSTLNRTSGHLRSQRDKQTVDDNVIDNRNSVRGGRITNRGKGSRNESVYSMSDSEDGEVYVARTLAAAYQKQTNESTEEDKNQTKNQANEATNQIKITNQPELQSSPQNTDSPQEQNSIIDQQQPLASNNINSQG